jgi:hypothetical protein
MHESEHLLKLPSSLCTSTDLNSLKKRTLWGAVDFYCWSAAFVVLPDSFPQVIPLLSGLTLTIVTFF